LSMKADHSLKAGSSFHAFSPTAIFPAPTAKQFVDLHLRDDAAAIELRPFPFNKPVRDSCFWILQHFFESVALCRDVENGILSA
jgi:hypothetical protein